MSSLRDAILNADDLPREAVPTPEWPEADGKLFVRVMSGKELAEFQTSISIEVNGQTTVDRINYRTKMLLKSVCGEDGKLLFSAEDLERLGEKNGATIDRLFAAAQTINKGGSAQRGEIAKNYDSGPT